jgi:hypothetical protein
MLKTSNLWASFMKMLKLSASFIILRLILPCELPQLPHQARDLSMKRLKK